MRTTDMAGPGVQLLRVGEKETSLRYIYLFFWKRASPSSRKLFTFFEETFFTKIVCLFVQRREGREKQKERNMDWLPPLRVRTGD